MPKNKETETKKSNVSAGAVVGGVGVGIGIGMALYHYFIKEDPQNCEQGNCESSQRPTTSTANDRSRSHQPQIINDVCSICQEGLTVRNVGPCGHEFHEKCIEPWLKEHNSCPNCRGLAEK